MENYEEKLKLAKEALESGSYDKETIEYIFPELKESKEERIRKWILEKFESYTGPCPFNREDIISWIKSQKSQLKLEENENYDQDEKIRKEIINMVRFYYGLNKALTQSVSEDDLVNWLEKRKQNSYSGVSFKYNGHTWGMCARDSGVDILLDGKFISHITQDEQKQEWSEEDENIRRAIINYLTPDKEDGIKDGEKVYDYTVQDFINWLNSRS